MKARGCLNSTELPRYWGLLGLTGVVCLFVCCGFALGLGSELIERLEVEIALQFGMFGRWWWWWWVWVGRDCCVAAGGHAEWLLVSFSLLGEGWGGGNASVFLIRGCPIYVLLLQIALEGTREQGRGQ